jgi:hypothetical protein
LVTGINPLKQEKRKKKKEKRKKKKEKRKKSPSFSDPLRPGISKHFRQFIFTSQQIRGQLPLTISRSHSNVLI